jgi:soluble lytic murein transglycosylase
VVAMARKTFYIWIVIGLLGLCAVTAGAESNSDVATDLETQREIFRAGWAAASRGDQISTLDAIARLPDYPIRPYLEFELLRQRIDQVPESVMEQFLARYRDWSFAPGLETAWLRSLGSRGEFEALVRHGRDATDARVQCYLGRADLEAGRTHDLAERAERLWLVGHSQDSACDPLFDWWRKQGYPTKHQGWRRFHLALSGGQDGLARYLRRYLDSDQRHWADLWLKMHARPQQTLREARQWPDHEQAQAIVRSGLQRLARSDWERARRLWLPLERRYSWSDEDAVAIEREIALFMAVALESEALKAIDGLPEHAINQQILEWRARAAMAHGDWNAVLSSIQAMGLAEQAQGRWRYWRGRALAELRRPEAMVAFSSLASEPNYYGFLAASRLGQDLTLCSEDISADPAIQRRLMRDSQFERAMELHQVGLFNHARRTWMQMSRRLSHAELDQAALLAAGQEWHDRAISALANNGRMQAYPWRFPLVEKGAVSSASQRWQVEPALIYGLMRAESAMQIDALSPAGARGLLQLMPATATAVAQRNGLTYRNAADLMNPEINIPLGVAHLAELEKRYDGQWIHVAAAYNAGINAVARWLDTRPLGDPDIWLETLPFFETRDYVPRVLAFATIYEWKMDQEPSVLRRTLLGDDVRHNGQGFACVGMR